LRNNIGDPKNTILIVGWTAPDTLGRRLADREKRVRIFGEPYEVKARVETIDGLSGHAGQDLLIRYATAVKSQVKKIFLVHGESKPAATLMGKLTEAGLREIYYPELHSSVSTSRKGLNMVNLVPTKETKTNAQAQRQDYPNNPISGTTPDGVSKSWTLSHK
jgi:hypothetical protein